jgi:SAM-dependent methyltransferase
MGRSSTNRAQDTGFWLWYRQFYSLFSEIFRKVCNYLRRHITEEPGLCLKISKKGIPAPDASFDAAFSACVFHHIPRSEHLFWLAELRRVVRPGGAIAVFEHNPFNPLTRRAVDTCPFDEHAVLLTARQLEKAYSDAGWQVLKARYHIFFPHFAARFRIFEPLLEWLPLGAQYSVFGRRPK